MNSIKFSSDIDIDVANRDKALALFKHTPASVLRDGKLTKHNTGVYFHDIPTDPFSGNSTIEYKSAEDRGYIKLDILNVGVYQMVKSEQHLLELMSAEPQWDMLYDPEFCAKLTHVGNHYDTLISMPEPVNSIPRMAMFLSVIRPAKRHLIGRTWKEVAETIWEKPTDGGYGYKKSHAISYANLVVVHMNLLTQSSSQV